jgi:hypothetical protein
MLQSFVWIVSNINIVNDIDCSSYNMSCTAHIFIMISISTVTRLKQSKRLFPHKCWQCFVLQMKALYPSKRRWLFTIRHDITSQMTYSFINTSVRNKNLAIFDLSEGLTISQIFHFVIFFFFYGSTALYGPGPPRFVEVSWSHTFETHHSR